jgi:glutathionyl-hydroquinone reductase
LEVAGSGLLPQGLIVSTARTAWRAAWKTFMVELAPQSDGGAYARPASAFQGVLGSPTLPFDASAAPRYRLYLGNACPWCHRVELALVARGLQSSIPITRLDDDPVRASRGGWVIGGNNRDPVFGGADLRSVYDGAAPGYRGRCTAPLLVDTLTKKIVSNDSAGIVAALDDVDGGANVRLRPAALAEKIDAVNDDLYARVCNGVYASGFATTQAAYDAAAAGVKAGLDDAEKMLESSPFLCGDKATDADLRLFPTIARLDAVYGPLFRATDQPLSAWPKLAAWAKRVAGIGGLKSTVDIAAARTSYYTSLFPLNPSGIVPSGQAPLRVLDGGEAVKAEDVFWGR